jgi:putative membrane protein
MTSSERRLHPSSVLFALGGHVRRLVVPGVLVLVTANAAGREWEAWLMWLLVPYAAIAIGRHLTFWYRYDATDLVIRSGFIFRNERHIPYSRIQNLDAVQNILQRLIGVVVVRIHTGGTGEVEATLSVLPVEALDEMRRRVLQFPAPIPSAAVGETSSAASAADGSPEAQAEAASAPHTLLHMSSREIVLAGVIHNYGGVIVAAVAGVVWEFGLVERLMGQVFGRQSWGGGIIRDLVLAIFAGRPLPLARLGAALAVIAILLILLRVVSVVIGIARLHGFTLARAGEELRTEFGLFTRVSATIPLRRVQTLSIDEGPLHRWLGRVSISVSTAGGSSGDGGEDGNSPAREAIAPIVPIADAPALVAEVLSGVVIDALPWRPVEAGARRREFVQALAIMLPFAVPFTWRLGWWVLAIVAGLVAWAALLASRQVRAMRWAMTDEVVAYRSGWIWRHVTIARLSRVQAVSLDESPFDRRSAMASVRVDTAGAAAHPVDIPYLSRADAEDLHAVVTSRVAQTRFAW